MPLQGGNVTEGVVRVGNTVRRPAGAWTPAVHAFLVHLESVGFEGSPRSYGIDDRDRHVLEWIPGDTSHPYRQLAERSPSLGEVGHLVRRFHDAAAGFAAPDDAAWNTVSASDRQDLVVHGDLAAWNFIHGAGRGVFIDWDAAGPGSQLWDLAWASHSFAGIAPSVDPGVAGQRLRAFIDGYGLDEDERPMLVGLLPQRYSAMYDVLAAGRDSGEEPWASMWKAGHGATWAAITSHAQEHHALFLSALLA